jgi:hypothetical protein
MTDYAEIRTITDGKTSAPTYGTAVNASWMGYTKNGYISMHVLREAGEYPATGTVALGWRMLAPLLKTIAEREIDRKLMADALREQGFKVVADEVA